LGRREKTDSTGREKSKVGSGGPVLVQMQQDIKYLREDKEPVEIKDAQKGYPSVQTEEDEILRVKDGNTFV